MVKAREDPKPTLSVEQGLSKGILSLFMLASQPTPIVLPPGLNPG